MRFFGGFEGPVALRKRVFRFSSSDNEWQFTGGVFVTFDTRENAEKFLNVDGHDLTYHGDTLHVKWKIDFYREKGLFKRQLDSLTRRA